MKEIQAEISTKEVELEVAKGKYRSFMSEHFGIIEGESQITLDGVIGLIETVIDLKKGESVEVR